MGQLLIQTERVKLHALGQAITATKVDTVLFSFPALEHTQGYFLTKRMCRNFQALLFLDDCDVCIVDNIPVVSYYYQTQTAVFMQVVVMF